MIVAHSPEVNKHVPKRGQVVVPPSHPLSRLEVLLQSENVLSHVKEDLRQYEVATRVVVLPLDSHVRCEKGLLQIANPQFCLRFGPAPPPESHDDGSFNTVLPHNSLPHDRHGQGMDVSSLDPITRHDDYV